MDIKSLINIIFTSYHSPFNFEVRDMNINILLTCKMLFFLLCTHGFIGYIDDPFIPFVPWFDQLKSDIHWFKWILKGAFIIFGLLLVFNFKTRLSVTFLGIITILVLMSSKPIFRNHLFICGGVFLLSGLLNKEQKPWLLYVQLALVYFGAVTNKISEIDWWNGQFMHNWLENARNNEIYILISSYLPEMLFAKLLSWSSMLIETLIAVLLLFKKHHKRVVWLILIFHTLLYTMTDFRFGHFFEDILIVMIIFVNFPLTKIKLSSRFKIFSFLNEIGAFNISIENQSKTSKFLKVVIDEKIFYNYEAIRRLLIHNTNFFISLFLLDFGLRVLFNNLLLSKIQLITTWVIFLFFIPMIWNVKKAFKNE